MDSVFFAKVEKGKILFSDKDLLKSIIASFEGKEIDVIIRKHRKDRSNNQNRYMWGCCYQLISEITGYTKDEVHDAMRLLFLLDKTRKIHTLKSTTELSTIDMEEYLENIRRWAAENLSCFIPLPNDVDIS